MTQLRLGIIGCAGKMGRMLLKEGFQSKECTLVGGIVKEGSIHQGQDLGELAGISRKGIYAHTLSEELFNTADILIDFTSPEATMNHIQLAKHFKKPLIIGTTGLSAEQLNEIKDVSQYCPIVISPNMSLGVTVMRSIVEKVAKILDQSFDIEINEFHHKHKVDAPSGTTLSLIKAAAKGRMLNDYNYTLEKKGPRKEGSIGVSILRGGSVVGDHNVIFAGEGEVLEIRHHALDRSIYAKGALKAAMWVKEKEPGLYTMKDVLGTKNL